MFQLLWQESVFDWNGANLSENGTSGLWSNESWIGRKLYTDVWNMCRDSLSLIEFRTLSEWSDFKMSHFFVLNGSRDSCAVLSQSNLCKCLVFKQLCAEYLTLCLNIGGRGEGGNQIKMKTSWPFCPTERKVKAESTLLSLKSLFCQLNGTLKGCWRPS